MQEKFEVVFRLSITRQNEPAAITGGEAHVDHLDSTEFFQDGLRTCLFAGLTGLRPLVRRTAITTGLRMRQGEHGRLDHPTVERTHRWRGRILDFCEASVSWCWLDKSVIRVMPMAYGSDRAVVCRLR